MIGYIERKIAANLSPTEVEGLKTIINSLTNEEVKKKFGEQLGKVEEKLGKELEEKNKNKRKIILKNHQSPGDIVTLTATIRDLHLTYPEQFLTDIDTSCPELWENNPYITKLDKNNAEIIQMKYPLVHNSNEGAYHFIHGFRIFLENYLKMPIKSTKFKGDIHISNQEKGWTSQVEEIVGKDIKYWIINAGGKKDFTNKWWDFNRYQEVVNSLKDEITFVQVGELNNPFHHHPLLENVIDLRGKTSIRQLVRLVYHSSGIITPVSLLMHLAPAVEVRHGKCLKNRPCVVIAGGREPVQWEMYPNHQYLHTCGKLSCCDNGGCWLARIEKLGDGDSKDNNLCLKPIKLESGQTIPKCLDMIKAEDVIRHIKEYNLI